MPSDMEGLDAMLNKILVEGYIKGKTLTYRVCGIECMNTYLSMEKVTVEIARTEKVVMGKENGICWLKTFVKTRRAIYPECFLIRFDTIGSMFKT